MHMSLTQVIGILVGGGMLLIGFCLVAYIVVLNKRLRQEAKDRYHDEEEGHMPVPKSANRGPAASAAGGSPARRPSFDKSLAMRELAAKEAELRGPEHERAVRQLQRFPVSPAPAQPATAASPPPTPQPRPQQQSPPRSAHSAFPGIPIKTPPPQQQTQQAPQQQQQQQQQQYQQQPQRQSPVPAPTSVPARTPVAASSPPQAQAPVRTPGTASPPPSKYVELSDVFGED